MLPPAGHTLNLERELEEGADGVRLVHFPAFSLGQLINFPAFFLDQLIRLHRRGRRHLDMMQSI
jgi:hypothetical protein